MLSRNVCICLAAAVSPLNDEDEDDGGRAGSLLLLSARLLAAACLPLEETGGRRFGGVEGTASRVEGLPLEVLFMADIGGGGLVFMLSSGRRLEEPRRADSAECIVGVGNYG